MFLGTYEPSLLGKGRIALSKKIRNEVAGERIVLTVGFEEAIFGFDEKTWEKVVRPELEKPLFSDKEARRMRRKMCVHATVVSLDSQGRCVIPKDMLFFAGIKDKITLIGAGDHFEIWESEKWKKYSKSL